MAPLKKSSSSKEPAKVKIPQSCEVLEKIFVYPEEIESLEKIAKTKKVPFQLELEDFVLDKKNQEILVIRYTLAKMQDSFCPFFDRTRKICSILPVQPKCCKSLPLAFESSDEEPFKITIIGPLALKYKHVKSEDLEMAFPDQFNLVQDAYTRLEEGFSFIGKLTENKEIEIDKNVDYAEFEKKLTTWPPIGIIPEPDEEASGKSGKCDGEGSSPESDE